MVAGRAAGGSGVSIGAPGAAARVQPGLSASSGTTAPTQATPEHGATQAASVPAGELADRRTSSGPRRRRRFDQVFDAPQVKEGSR